MVSVTPEAVETLDRALGLLADRHRGLWTQATARITAARTDIANERNRRATVVAALAAALSSARDADRATIAAQLAAARESVRRAEQALAQADAADRRVAAARHRAAVSLEPALSGGRADLRRRAQALGHFSAAHGHGNTRPAPSASPATRPDALADHLTRCGVMLVDLETVDFSDNPIVGPFGRGGAGLPDYRWAVETWETIVRPGLAAGLSREDFAARDSDRQVPPLRRTADVYDLFLGDDAIRLDRGPHGTLTVVGGRHRIQVARQLGIRTLPARTPR